MRVRVRKPKDKPSVGKVVDGGYCFDVDFSVCKRNQRFYGNFYTDAWKSGVFKISRAIKVKKIPYNLPYNEIDPLVRV